MVDLAVVHEAVEQCLALLIVVLWFTGDDRVPGQCVVGVIVVVAFGLLPAKEPSK